MNGSPHVMQYILWYSGRAWQFWQLSTLLHPQTLHRLANRQPRYWPCIVTLTAPCNVPRWFIAKLSSDCHLCSSVIHDCCLRIAFGRTPRPTLTDLSAMHVHESNIAVLKALCRPSAYFSIGLLSLVALVRWNLKVFG